MIKRSAEIRDFKLPFFVPKRNKGHNEVLVRFLIKSWNFQDSEDFIQVILPFSKTVLSAESLKEIAREIKEGLDLENFFIQASFLFHLDRTSPRYFPSSHQLPCNYELFVENEILKIFMGIKLPVRVKGVFPLQGELSFSIEESKSVYFEDLLDHIQKHAGVKLYPKASSKEEEELKFLMDEGKTPQEYINILMNYTSLKELGEGGVAHISFMDVYSNYILSQEGSWENKDVKFLTSLKEADNIWEDKFIERMAKEIINELSISSLFLTDVIIVLREEMNKWKERVNEFEDSFKNYGKIVHKFIKAEVKIRIRKELKNLYRIYYGKESA